MIVFPHAKINLGLRIVGGPSPRASGGFHAIETVLVPVNFRDVLEVVPSPTGKSQISVSGLPIPGPSATNLCIRAYNALFDATSGCSATQQAVAAAHETKTSGRSPATPPPVHIWLHKKIPPGSGLGGGSSNAAAMLTLLNAVYNLEVPQSRLVNLARRLGSDCPFFLQNNAMLATGRGDVLRPVHLGEIGNLDLLIVIPPIHISTARAYARIRPSSHTRSLTGILTGPPSQWQQHLANDFEPIACARYPVIQKIKDHLIGLGAAYASLSGTGSAVFGLFAKTPPLSRVADRFPEALVVPASIGV